MSTDRYISLMLNADELFLSTRSPKVFFFQSPFLLIEKKLLIRKIDSRQ